MHELLNTLNTLAQFIPFDDALYAPLLSVVLLITKKVAKIKNGEVMVWLTVAGSVVFAAVAYIVSHPNENPQVAAMSAVVIAATSQPFYRLVLRPLSKAIGKVWLAQVNKAARLNSEVKSAAVPATGLPISGVEVQQFDK
jgi:hypothetical protein